MSEISLIRSLSVKAAVPARPASCLRATLALNSAECFLLFLRVIFLLHLYSVRGAFKGQAYIGLSRIAGPILPEPLQFYFVASSKNLLRLQYILDSWLDWFASTSIRLCLKQNNVGCFYI
jgi:hypothetical protein